jgi:hypothetical protein
LYQQQKKHVKRFDAIDYEGQWDDDDDDDDVKMICCMVYEVK